MTQTKWRILQAIVMGAVMILLRLYSPPPSYSAAFLGADVAATPNGPAFRPARQTQSGTTEGGVGHPNGPAFTPTKQTQSGAVEGGHPNGPAFTPSKQTQSGSVE
jgi:hypothetical protein